MKSCKPLLTPLVKTKFTMHLPNQLWSSAIPSHYSAMCALSVWNVSGSGFSCLWLEILFFLIFGVNMVFLPNRISTVSLLLEDSSSHQALGPLCCCCAFWTQCWPHVSPLCLLLLRRINDLFLNFHCTSSARHRACHMEGDNACWWLLSNLLTWDLVTFQWCFQS